MKHALLCLSIVLSVSDLFSQFNQKCGTDTRMIEAESIIWTNIDKSFKAFYQDNKYQRNIPVSLVIPVHVVVIHKPGQSVGVGDNVSLQRILSQLQVMNEDFGLFNNNANSTPAVFSKADTEIRFCLATVDPNGASSEGVTRYATNQSIVTEEIAIKSATKWPADKYLNIWVAPLEGLQLGFAYIPTQSSLPSSAIDGVVVNTTAFGGPGFATFARYNLGRTATHEVGHYLGLKHIWASDGCGNDDGINDTPQQDVSSLGCPVHPRPSCSNGGDMYMNYMDYSDDVCMSAFTNDQGVYMRAILQSSRAALVSQNNTSCTYTQPLVWQNISTTNINCYGQSSGGIVASAMGNDTISYWIIGQPITTSGLFQNLFSGTYTVFASDGIDTVSQSVILTQPEQVKFAVDELRNVSCAGQNSGVLDVSTLGGIDFTFKLGSQSNTSGRFEGLKAGLTEISATNHIGCKIDSVFIIEESEPLQMKLSVVSPAECEIDSVHYRLSVEGGNAPYSIMLDNMPVVNNQIISLTLANHRLRLTDSLDCVLDTSFTVESYTPLSVAINHRQLACANKTGDAVVSISGGQMPYKIIYSDGSQSVLENGHILSGLLATSYSYTITDHRGCTRDIVFIMPNEEFEFTINSISAPLCPDVALGFVNLKAISPRGIVQRYELDNQVSSLGSFSNIVPGPYQVAAFDITGCADTAHIDIPVSEPYNIGVVVEDALCSNSPTGKITVTNGKAGYTYNIAGIGFNTIGVFDEITSGTYLLEITNSFGCVFDTSITVGPNELSAETILQSGIWNTDAIIQVRGGTPPYFYSIDGSPVILPLDTIKGLLPGSYVIWIHDSNNCLFNEILIITGTEETLKANTLKINIYPNPAKDYFKVQVMGYSNSTVSLQLTDVFGKIVEKIENINFNNTNDDYIFYVKSLSNSIYILNIAVDNKIISRKVVVR